MCVMILPTKASGTAREANRTRSRIWCVRGCFARWRHDGGGANFHERCARSRIHVCGRCGARCGNGTDDGGTNCAAKYLTVFALARSSLIMRLADGRDERNGTGAGDGLWYSDILRSRELCDIHIMHILCVQFW